MIGDAPSTAFATPQMPPRIARPAALWAGFCRYLEHLLEAERERLPLWLPVLLGTGIAAWFILPAPRTWLAWIAGSLGIALIGLVIGSGSRAGRAVLIIGCCAAAGCALIWFRADHVSAPVLARPVVTALDMEVLSIERRPARDIVQLHVRAPGRTDLPPYFTVNVAEEDVPPGIGRGAVVRGRARLMPPPGASLPGGYDFRQGAWFSGMGATGRAFAPLKVIRRGQDENGLRTRLAAYIQERAGGPVGAGAVAATLATGDRGAIPEDDAEAMRNSGLAHLLSISGLHVTAVVGAAFFLTLRLLALSPYLALRLPILTVAAGAGAAVGIAYTLLTGAEVPTIRSCVAAFLVLAAMALGREAFTLRLVACGALFVLLLYPESMMGPSFQMSFAAVTTIVVLHQDRRFAALVARREEALVWRLARELLGLFLMGLAIELVLAPIALFHFHKAGVYGAIANMIAIPLTTFVVMPVEALALVLDLIGLGAPAWWVVAKALELLLWIAHHVAALPGATSALPAGSGMGFGCFILGYLWFALWRTRMRVAGLPLMGAGFALMLLARPPDLLITADGAHVAVRSKGGLAILRPRSGDYVRDMLAEIAGHEGELGSIDSLDGARCSRDMCLFGIERGDRRWTIAATRSGYYLPRPELERTCRSVDIIVSDRGLPRWCRPRWLKADRWLLARYGGLSLDLTRRTVRHGIDPADRHPWLVAEEVAPPYPDHRSKRRKSGR